MKKVLVTLCFLFAVTASSLQAAEQCKSTISVGDVISDSWVLSCESSRNISYYDPYNPNPYLARFFTFTLDREADIKIDLTGGFQQKIYLVDGEYAAGEVLFQTTGSSLKTYLPAGAYTIEVSNNYTTSFTLNVSYNDLGSSNCLQSIASGVKIDDGWISGCESNHRDVVDPYSPYPDAGYRAKYFTFSLDADSDIKISIDPDVNAYLYILPGHGLGEFEVPLVESNDNNILTSLPLGDYTLELTTYKRYDPGKFSIQFDVLSNDSLCTQPLVFDQVIQENWPTGCTIQTWDNTNNDPYVGINPERAIYYTFQLTEANDLKITTHVSDAEVLWNIYRDGDFTKLVKSNFNNSYWYGNTENDVSMTLAAGNYTMELTSYNQVALGNYQFKIAVLGTSVCSQTVSIDESYNGLLADSCISQHRKGVSNDPYAPQPGDYYARRFEFELEEPMAIRATASLNSGSPFLYLSQMSDSGALNLLDESEFDYWSSKSNVSLNRVLDKGKYVVELTSAHPFKNESYNFSIVPVNQTECEIFLPLNTKINTNISLNCPSSFKESYRNPDPYIGPREFTYPSKLITFKVEAAGNVTFDIKASNFKSHLFTIIGVDRNGDLLIDEQMREYSGEVTNYLEAGFYTLEVTSSETASYNNFELEIISEKLYEPVYIPQNINCENNLELLNSDVLTAKFPTTCENDLIFKFSLEETIEFDVTYRSNSSSQIVIERFNGVDWDSIYTAISNDSSENIKRFLNAGIYRLRLSSSTTNQFTLVINKSYGKDSDGDGILDIDDDFPDDDSRAKDIDNDGIDDLYDNDLDNDGALNANDAFPTDSDKTSPDNIVDDSSNNIKSGVVEFENSEFSIDEDLQQVTVKVIRTNADPESPGIFMMKTIDGSAKAIRDYVPLEKIILMEPGETESLIILKYEHSESYDDLFYTVELKRVSREVSYTKIFRDIDAQDISEAKKERMKAQMYELLLNIGDVFNSFNMKIGSDNRREIQIPNDKTPGSLLKWNKEEAGFDETSGTVSLEVKREGDSASEATVNFSTIDGTAIAGIDYQAQSGILKFSEGEISKFIQVEILDNMLAEVNRYFDVELTYATGVTLSNESSKRVTIIDNDLTESHSLVGFGQESIELNEYHGHLGIEVQRSGNLDQKSIVEWRIKNDSAIDGIDYIDRQGVVEFGVGDDTQQIYIRLLGDSEIDGDKGLAIELYNPDQNTAFRSRFQFITLLDIDDVDNSEKIKKYEFSSNEYSVEESSESYQIAVLRTLPRNLAESVSYSVKAVTASSEDYMLSNGTLEFSDGESEEEPYGTGEYAKPIILSVINDDVYEGLEYFEISLSGETLDDISGNSETYTTTTKVYIKDNDVPPLSGELRFSGESFNFLEDSGKALITVQRINGDVGEVSVDYHTADDTAVSGKDYESINGSLIFLDGETSKTVEIDLINNDLDEQNRSFNVVLSNPVGTIISGSLTVPIEIEDDEVPPKTDESAWFGATGFWVFGITLLLFLVFQPKRREVA